MSKFSKYMWQESVRYPVSLAFIGILMVASILIGGSLIGGGLAFVQYVLFGGYQS